MQVFTQEDQKQLDILLAKKNKALRTEAVRTKVSVIMEEILNSGKHFNVEDYYFHDVLYDDTKLIHTIKIASWS